MNCPTCGDKPKKMAQSFTKAVIEIDNPEQIALLRKVVIPASMGDDESIPAAIGKYRNVILHYEANQHTYIYSSDGIPTFLEMSIPEEVMNRIATLETSMSKETLDRKDADATLQNNINAEALTRKNADDALDGRLTTVEGIAATALQPASIDKVVMTDISLNANSSTTTVQIDGAKENLLTGAQTTKNLPLPVASHDEAGVMNSSTFDAVTNNTSNINALMNGAVAITGISASPSQSDLTTAWQTETGLTTLMNRAGIYDVTNNKVWTYYTNDSTWYAATNTSQVTINTFTNSAEGTIKGSTNVGQIFAENDGTGSVNGWDSLSGNVSTNTNDISSLQTTVAGKQDKLTAGQNITITGNVISATGNSYTAGNAIHIDSADNNRIDADIYPADFFTAGETLTGTGSNITLNETIPAKLKGVELYGDTFQQTYSGKNLVNTPNDTRSSGGLDIVWSDNICTFSGTASSTSAILTTLTTLGQNLPQGTYTFSIQEATTYDIRLSVLNADTSNYVNYDIAAGSTSVSININYNTVSYRILAKGWSNGDSVSGALKQPMFEVGSAPTDYEPYVGGTASPNPDYPQTVNVVTGEQNVWVHGKNLFNNNATPTAKINDNSLGITPLTTGVRLTSGASVSYSGVVYIIGKKQEYIGKTLTFTTHSKSSSTNNSRVYIGTCNSDGGNRTTKANGAGDSGEYDLSVSWQVIDDDSNEYICIALYTTASVSITAGVYMDYTNTQLEIGSVASPYEPYQGANYTIDLGAAELCKIGDYQDYIYKSGDDWYVHKETKKVIFDGSEDEDWATGSSGGVRFFRIDSSDGADNSEHLVKIISDRFIGRFDTASNSIAMSASVQGRILIFINGITNDVAVWKTWLVSNNVTAYYALATATNTKITDNNLIGQLNTLASANAYLDTTHFLTTATGTNLPVILDIVAYKKSLDGVISSIPNAQVQSNWTQADTTAPDYIKNKPTIPAAQIQSDWDQADNSAVDYIKNKPTIPTVNDATLTIQQNGVDITTFTANASSNATANITSPVITMTTTDPGEGSALADNNYIGVYGGDPIIMDYSITEVNTGAKWINGSAIYKKTVNTGALPNATTKNVAHGISNLSKIIRLEGYGLRSTDNVMCPLPFASSTGATADISVTVDGTNIAIRTGVDRSNITESYITLYYTKSS